MFNDTQINQLGYICTGSFYSPRKNIEAVCNACLNHTLFDKRPRLQHEVGRVTDSPKSVINACNISGNRGVTPVEAGRKVRMIFGRRIAKQRAINRIRSLALLGLRRLLVHKMCRRHGWLTSVQRLYIKLLKL